MCQLLLGGQGRYVFCYSDSALLTQLCSGHRLYVSEWALIAKSQYNFISKWKWFGIVHSADPWSRLYSCDNVLIPVLCIQFQTGDELEDGTPTETAGLINFVFEIRTKNSLLQSFREQ